MQLLWTFSVVSTLLSMGLLAVITGRDSAFQTLSGQIEDQMFQLDGLQARQIRQEAVSVSLEEQLVQAVEAAGGLQAAVARLASELERATRESDACRAQKVWRCPSFFLSQDPSGGLLVVLSGQ